MKIKYQGSRRLTELSEIFYIGFFKYDIADYCFTITLFGRDWEWFFFKKGTEC
jgi:hypothetical protein